jgi:hypothetical protein
MATFTFNPTGTATRFAEYIAEHHSDSCIASQRANLLKAVSDAFSMYVRSDNQTDIQKIVASIKDKDINGSLIRQGVRSAFEVYPKGFTPSKEHKSFKTMTPEQQKPYIAGHAKMMAAFEGVIVNYLARPVKTDEERQKSKIERAARAERKLQDSIKAMGLVDPSTVRPLNDDTIVGLIIDMLQAGGMSLDTLTMLEAEITAAKLAAAQRWELEAAREANKTKTNKTKANKAKADREAFDAEPPFAQAAILAATA